MPGAAESWWALMTARTGAYYVESNHIGAQAARLSVLSSAHAAASSLSALLGCPGAPRPRLCARSSQEGQIHSSPGIYYPPGAASCIISISSEAGSGWGRRRREGSESRKEAAADASFALLSTRGCLGSSAWALRMTLGRPVCAASPGRAARFLPILGARGRSSGRSRRAGLRTREALLALGTQQPAHSGPLEKLGAPLSGNNQARGLPGMGRRCQRDPAAGRVCTRRCPPRGSLPLRQEHSLRRTAACGAPAPPSEGAAPSCRTEAGRRRRLVLVVRPASRLCAPGVQKRTKSPCPLQDQATAPQPATCQCAPQPGLIIGAQHPGNDPTPVRLPSAPSAPGTRLSSAPLPQLS